MIVPRVLNGFLKIEVKCLYIPEKVESNHFLGLFDKLESE